MKWTIKTDFRTTTHAHLFPISIKNIPNEFDTIELVYLLTCSCFTQRQGLLLFVLPESGSLMHGPNAKLWLGFIVLRYVAVAMFIFELKQFILRGRQR
jgi:hypothetical protein